MRSDEIDPSVPPRPQEDVTESMAATRRMIALPPIGDLSRNTVMVAASDVSEAFSAEVIAAPAIPLPANAYDPARRQYLTRALLDALAARKRPEWERLLGVVDEDLYAPGLNFAFGEADPDRGIAVLSLARLWDSGRQIVTDRFRRRFATEAIHELGHTYGLGHCAHPSCVMWFSNTLAETDRKEPRFCRGHQAELRAAMDAAVSQ
jgi:archaemetzincin